MTVVKQAIKHLKEFGLRHTVYVAMRSLLLWLSHFMDEQRDRRLGVQTTGEIPVRDLGVASANRIHSEDYVPTPAPVLRQAVSAIQGDFRDLVFIDVGSGKGRVLFNAAKYPFKKIIGLEFSEQLHQLCQQNIASLRRPRRGCQDIISIHTDALEYALPDDELFIFMFNPFSADLVQGFIDRLEAHFRASGKRIYIAYYNPKHGDILQKASFLKDAPNDPPLFYCTARPVWPLATFVTREN